MNNIWFRVSISLGFKSRDTLEDFGMLLTKDEQHARSFFESTKSWPIFNHGENTPLCIFEKFERNGLKIPFETLETINMDWSR